MQFGGIVLHEGCIAEMATGEGKTLVATLPAYLHALTGKGVHVLTTNDYLAKRDAQRCVCVCVWFCMKSVFSSTYMPYLHTLFTHTHTQYGTFVFFPGHDSRVSA